MRYEAHLDNLPKMLDETMKLVTPHVPSEEAQLQMRLALEEALVNIISYAYPDKKEKQLTIDVLVEAPFLKLILTDWGKPFDPTTFHSEFDPTIPLEARPLGGLGILFIKKMMDDMHYIRHDDANVLTLFKRL